jgi:hypothetical protein
VKIVRPKSTAPLAAPRQHAGTVVARFVVIMAIIVVVLAVAWHR